MGFIQIIEISTSRFDELEALHEQWLRETEGKRTVVAERICRDRDDPDRYLMVVEFPSYEAAMENNGLDATTRIAEGMTALADEPPTFRNLDLVRAD